MIWLVSSVNTPSGPSSSRPSASIWSINRSNVSSSITGRSTVGMAESLLSWRAVVITGPF